MEDAVNLNDFEEIARGRMEAGAFDYYAGGAGEEITLRENVLAFQRRRLRPRVLNDITGIDTTTTILGRRAELPIGLPPTALHGLAHPEGELASGRACADAGIVFCLSTLSSRSIEEVAAASSGRRWFQLYVHNERPRSREIVRRAESAGYEALVLTADLPMPGYRERELRRGFTAPRSAFGNFRDLESAGDDLISVIGSLHDHSLSWDDLAWVKSLSSLPLVIKGIMTGEDAALAVEHGAGAIVVSNHGGRQLDRSNATLDVLEEVVSAVGGRVEVYMDGGVRRGTDVATALALGARAVFIGRPFLYALAAGGEAGVAKAISLIQAELRTTMALLGVTSPAQLNPSHVQPLPVQALQA
ncbi:MAG: alpha-hydroxy-acid oxidizing protein [Dehalococcoidia bacterium]|nr:alpha-hydroxy-acid oxidizing protein [Dehalococcoidia bacterium]